MKVTFDEHQAPATITAKTAPEGVWFWNRENDRYGMKTRAGVNVHTIWVWKTATRIGTPTMGANFEYLDYYANQRVELMPPGFTISFTNE